MAAEGGGWARVLRGDVAGARAAFAATVEARPASSSPRAAALADPDDALFGLGWCYVRGWGGDADVPRGETLIAQAAAEGSKRARAVKDLVGIGGQRPEAVRALAQYRALADGGDTWAQFELANMHANGDAGAVRDLARAIELYVQAAARGHVVAAAYAGVAYYKGAGVARDRVRSAALFEQAAAAGDATGQRYLADQLVAGDGVARDPQRALALYELAAAQGSMSSRLALAICFAAGVGVPAADPARAQAAFAHVDAEDIELACMALATAHAKAAARADGDANDGEDEEEDEEEDPDEAGMKVAVPLLNGIRRRLAETPAAHSAHDLHCTAVLQTFATQLAQPWMADGAAATAALLAGSIVETASPPATAVADFGRALIPLVARAVRRALRYVFAIQAAPTVDGGDADDVGDTTDEVVCGRRLAAETVAEIRAEDPEGAAAFTALNTWFKPAAAVWTRVPAVLAEAQRTEQLASGLQMLPFDASDGVFWLRSLLAVALDVPLVVVFPELAEAYTMRIDGVADVGQLTVLLADALAAPLARIGVTERPHEALLALNRGEGPQESAAGGATYVATFQLYPWQSLDPATGVPVLKRHWWAAPGGRGYHSLPPDYLMGDLTEVHGHRALILQGPNAPGQVPLRRIMPNARSFERLAAAIHDVRQLSSDDTARWQAVLATSSQAALASAGQAAPAAAR